MLSHATDGHAEESARPILYGFPQNCFCAAVHQAIKALGQEPGFVMVSYGNRSQIIQLTGGAYYLVPVLQHQQQIITDSQRIGEYVDAQFGAGRLFPPQKQGLQTLLLPYLKEECHHAVEQLTDVPLIDSLSDIVEKTLIVRHKERKFGKGCVEKWRGEIPRLYATLVQLLLPFEQMLGHSSFLLDSTPVYLDFMLYGIFANLTYADFYPFPKELPRLQTWHQKLAEYRY